MIYVEKETTKRTIKEKNISITEAYKIMFKDYPDVINIKELSEMLGVYSKNCKPPIWSHQPKQP